MPMGGPLSLWEKPSCKKLRGPMGGTKSKPNAVDSIWNGGARERQNECAMSFAIEMKKLVASDMSLATSWQVASIRIFCLSRFRHQSVEVTLIIFVLNDIDRFFHCQQLV